MYLRFMLALSVCSGFSEQQALPRVGLGPLCRHWLCIAWSCYQGQGLHACTRTECPSRWHLCWEQTIAGRSLLCF